MKTIELSKELAKYAKELNENILEYEIINKTSYKYLNFYRKKFMELLKKEYPNLDQNLTVSYNSETNQLFFYEKLL